MKPLKRKTKVLLAACAIVVVGIGYFLKPLFGRNGKADAGPILAEANKYGFQCEWTGFVKSRKTGLFQIFVACDISVPLQNTTASNQDELKSEIEEKVIRKLAPVVPDEENLSVAFISRVDESTVLCTDVRNKKIRDSWYDSYDNYCMP